MQWRNHNKGITLWLYLHCMQLIIVFFFSIVLNLFCGLLFYLSAHVSCIWWLILFAQSYFFKYVCNHYDNWSTWTCTCNITLTKIYLPKLETKLSSSYYVICSCNHYVNIYFLCFIFFSIPINFPFSSHKG